ncbi:MAG TPA: hypothetical protein VGN02_06325 [Paenibacillus sp.]|jgi:outer membrane protein assembly factor BamB
MMSSSKPKFAIILLSAIISVSALFPLSASAVEAPKFTIDSNLKINDFVIQNAPLVPGNPKAQVRWEHPMEKPSTSPVLSEDDDVYLGGGYKIYAFLPDGGEKWESDLGGFATGTPTLGADGTLYAGIIKLDANALKAYLYVCAIDPNGKKRWEFPMGGLKKLWIPDLSPPSGWTAQSTQEVQTAGICMRSTRTDLKSGFIMPTDSP